MVATSFDYKLEEAPRYPVAYCEHCGEELYTGDEAVTVEDYRNTLFCSRDCMDDWLGVKEIEVGDC